ncbi:hypothetical protein GVAV_002049 [Gurleya vavrai]
MDINPMELIKHKHYALNLNFRRIKTKIDKNINSDDIKKEVKELMDIGFENITIKEKDTIDVLIEKYSDV